jgi:hypothetical protein
MSDERVALNNQAIDLLIVVGLIESVIDRYPQHVRENFTQKIERLTEEMTAITSEFIDFGEAYDDEAGG